MKKEIVISARTVEEALEKATAELGAPDASAVEYTVIEEPKKGFLGIGGTPAKISASYETVLYGKAAAVAFVEKLIADMQLDAKVNVRDGDNGDTVISIEGESAGVLIGHHGDTLDSLQYLANLAANKKIDGEKKEYCKITVDIENYRAKRAETLRTLARHMANKVVRYKKSVMLEPMNPYERRIIHSEIQGIPGVSTNSIGSENNRKIVIYLDDKKGE
ncbi:MAG: RNA-binding cell elongation regulator Jag/EloR [Clostridia bacterium]|nr:RNA-binding cell elongation regulator Jag/EloR [Clostridia bacterium]